MNKRVGAKNLASVDPAVLKMLNRGEIESANLVEGLAVDFAVLMANALPIINPSAISTMRAAAKLGVTKRMELAATIIRQHADKKISRTLIEHPSDTVRGWAAYMIGMDSTLPLEKKLNSVKQLADDTHFGVREWAWIALRPAVSADIKKSITLLREWVDDRSENVRRFAIEITRPRGVWSAHIPALKESPELAQPLLDQVMSDSARYVQNSCANWLNDAAKSNLPWVQHYCAVWQSKSASVETVYIVKRALRSVE
jgi:3-methyladenine DNA glycosylase AlkC